MDEIEQTSAENQPAEQGPVQPQLSEESLKQLTDLGINAQDLSQDELVTQLLKKHSETGSKLKKEGSKRQEAERKLESLELSKLLGSEEITDETRVKLHGLVTKATATEETLNLLVSEGLVSEGIAELLKLGDSRAAAAAIKLGIKPDSQELSGEQLVAEVTRQVKQELGLGEDLGEPRQATQSADNQKNKRPSYESEDMHRARGFIANFKLKRGA